MEQTRKPKTRLRRWGHGPNPLILKKSPTRCPERAPAERDGYAVERAAFARARSELIEKYPGKFVVFVGGDMLGPFDTFVGAVHAAHQKHGYVAVYTKQLIVDDAAR